MLALLKKKGSLVYLVLIFAYILFSLFQNLQYYKIPKEKCSIMLIKILLEEVSSLMFNILSYFSFVLIFWTFYIIILVYLFYWWIFEV